VPGRVGGSPGQGLVEPPEVCPVYGRRVEAPVDAVGRRREACRDCSRWARALDEAAGGLQHAPSTSTSGGSGERREVDRKRPGSSNIVIDWATGLRLFSRKTGQKHTFLRL